MEMENNDYCENKTMNRGVNYFFLSWLRMIYWTTKTSKMHAKPKVI